MYAMWYWKGEELRPWRMEDFEGYSYADIGEVLDLSESQVKALLHRARKSFAVNFAGRYGRRSESRHLVCYPSVRSSRRQEALNFQ